MVSIEKRLEAFVWLGSELRAFLDHPEDPRFEDWNQAILSAFHKNGWFTRSEVEFALNYWAEQLRQATLNEWMSTYEASNSSSGKRVLLVLAGNIPMVGFHDVLSTILSGNFALIKCSSTDDVLIPFLLSKTSEAHPELKESFQILTGIVKDIDAAIATGSNNSARHFEDYFGHLPNIIRKNRTGVAVLKGDESDEDLLNLMEDAFRYFGLGCRNITKLYLPEGFDLNNIFRSSLSFSHMMDNKKYANNYTYHKALMMLERQSFLENDLILMREADALYAPVSVLHYEYFDSPETLNDTIERQLDDIQCVVGKDNIPFGSAQKPALSDYADGVDTMEFLRTI